MKVTNGMKINQKIRQRVLDTADYIIRNRATVRRAAEDLHISKSTVHIDMTERLKVIDPELHKKARDILNYHLKVRHIRGGEATKMLYRRTV